MSFIGRTITVVVVAVVVSGIAAACDSPSTSAQQATSAQQTAPRSPATAPAPAPGAAAPATPAAPASQPASQPSVEATRARPVVALLDFGQPPYQELRYSPRAGDKQTLELTIKTNDKPQENSSQLPGQKYPDIKVTIDAQVQEVAANGDIRYSLAFTKGDVVSDPEVMPAVVERYRKSANALVGVTATTEVSDRGAIKKSKLDVPANADPAMVTVLRRVDIALEQLWTMLPDEPIGVGGKWRVDFQSDASSNNVHYKHSVVYQIAEAEGSQVRLAATVQDKGDRQPIPKQATAGAGNTTLSSLTGTGRGEMKLELTKIMPLLAEMFVQTQTNVDVDMGGSVQGVSGHFVIESRIETKSK